MAIKWLNLETNYRLALEIIQHEKDGVVKNYVGLRPTTDKAKQYFQLFQILDFIANHDGTMIDGLHVMPAEKVTLNDIEQLFPQALEYEVELPEITRHISASQQSVADILSDNLREGLDKEIAQVSSQDNYNQNVEISNEQEERSENLAKIDSENEMSQEEVDAISYEGIGTLCWTAIRESYKPDHDSLAKYNSLQEAQKLISLKGRPVKTEDKRTIKQALLGMTIARSHIEFKEYLSQSDNLKLNEVRESLERLETAILSNNSMSFVLNDITEVLSDHVWDSLEQGDAIPDTLYTFLSTVENLKDKEIKALFLDSSSESIDNEHTYSDVSTFYARNVHSHSLSLENALATNTGSIAGIESAFINAPYTPEPSSQSDRGNDDDEAAAESILEEGIEAQALDESETELDSNELAEFIENNQPMDVVNDLGELLDDELEQEAVEETTESKDAGSEEGSQEEMDAATDNQDENEQLTDVDIDENEEDQFNQQQKRSEDTDGVVKNTVKNLLKNLGVDSVQPDLYDSLLDDGESETSDVLENDSDTDEVEKAEREDEPKPPALATEAEMSLEEDEADTEERGDLKEESELNAERFDPLVHITSADLEKHPDELIRDAVLAVGDIVELRANDENYQPSSSQIKALWMMPKSTEVVDLQKKTYEAMVETGMDGNQAVSAIINDALASRQRSRNDDLTDEERDLLKTALIHELGKSQLLDGTDTINSIVPKDIKGEITLSLPKEIRSRMSIEMYVGSEFDKMIVEHTQPDVRAMVGSVLDADFTMRDKNQVVFGVIPKSTKTIYRPESGYAGLSETQYITMNLIDNLAMDGKMVVLFNHNFMDSSSKDHLAYMKRLSTKVDISGGLRIPIHESIGKNLEVNSTRDLLVFRPLRENEIINEEALWLQHTEISIPKLWEDSFKETYTDEEDLIEAVENNVQATASGIVNSLFAPDRINLMGDYFVGKRLNVDEKFTTNINDQSATDYFTENIEELVIEPVFDQEGSSELRFEIHNSASFTRVFERNNPDLYVGGLIATATDDGEAIYGRVSHVKEADNGNEIEATVLIDESHSDAIRARTHDYLVLREAVRNTLEAQKRTTEETDEVTASRANLNETYDLYVKKHGPLHSKKSKSVLQQDPIYGQTIAIELWDRRQQTASKGQIFTERVIHAVSELNKPQTVKEAINASLLKHKEARPEYIAELLDKNWSEIKSEAEEYLFLDPAKNAYVEKQDYLSGNVGKKYEQAKYAAQFVPDQQRNVEALKTVIPEKIPFEKISINMGARYIDREIVFDFVCGYLGLAKRRASMSMNDSGRWKVKISRLSKAENDKLQESLRGLEVKITVLIEDIVNNNSTVIRKTVSGLRGEERIIDTQQTDAVVALKNSIYRDFLIYVETNNEIKERIVDNYNMIVNQVVPRKWDGSMLSVQGMSPNYPLYESQINGAYRFLMDGSLSIAHEAGSGKTFLMTVAAMASATYRDETSLIVAKKSTLPKFYDEIHCLFPQARVLLVTSEMARKDRVIETMSCIKYGNFDIVLMGNGTYESRVDLSLTHYESITQNRITNLEALKLTATRHKKIDNEINKALTGLAKIKERHVNERPLIFEEMGIDNLFIDEAHSQKNMPFKTRFRKINGLTHRPSARAIKTKGFIRHLYNKKQGEEGVILATGTPISKSFGEMYVLAEALRPSVLADLGIKRFDDFAAMYCDVVETVEPTITGDVKINSYLEIVNPDALSDLITQFVDYASVDDEKVKRPDLNHVINVVPKDDLMIVKDLEIRDRLEALKNENMEPLIENDNQLKIDAEMNLVAVDPQLAYPELTDQLGSKLTAVAAKTIQHYIRIRPTNKGTQVIFLDQGVPGGSSKANLYEQLTRTLVENGIPRDEIAWAHDAKNEDQLQGIFDRMNNGELAVLIGSSEKIGEGCNYQERLAVGHLPCHDWTPVKAIQNIARFHRQGNIFSDVHAEIYMVSNSSDTARTAREVRTAPIIKAFFANEKGKDNYSEHQTMTAEERSVLAWDLVELVEEKIVERDLQRIEGDRKRHEEMQKSSRKELFLMEASITNMESEKEWLKEQKETVDAWFRKNEVDPSATKLEENEKPYSEIVQPIHAITLVQDMRELGLVHWNNDKKQNVYNDISLGQGTLQVITALIENENGQSILDRIRKDLEENDTRSVVTVKSALNMVDKFQEAIDSKAQHEKDKKAENERIEITGDKPTKEERAFANRIYPNVAMNCNNTGEVERVLASIPRVTSAVESKEVRIDVLTSLCKSKYKQDLSPIRINGKPYTPENAAAKIAGLSVGANRSQLNHITLSLRGVPVAYREYSFTGNSKYHAVGGSIETETLRGMLNKLTPKALEKAIERIEKNISEENGRRDGLTEIIEKPFNDEDKYHQLVQKHQELSATVREAMERKANETNHYPRSSQEYLDMVECGEFTPRERLTVDTIFGEGGVKVYESFEDALTESEAMSKLYSELNKEDETTSSSENSEIDNIRQMNQPLTLREQQVDDDLNEQQRHGGMV